MNYTPEIVAYMLKTYTENPSRETADALAKELDKPIRSIIGKLSKEGVYRRDAYKTKTGETPVTKLEIVADLEQMLNLNLQGLEKSPKLVLKTLKRGLNELLEFNELL